MPTTCSDCGDIGWDVEECPYCEAPICSFCWDKHMDECHGCSDNSILGDEE